MAEKKPIIILGNGGHSGLLYKLLSGENEIVLGVVGQEKEDVSNFTTYLGDDSILLKYKSNDVLLVNGIGSVGNTSVRDVVYKKFKDKEFSFKTIVHPKSYIENDVVLEEGVQVMLNTVIQAGVKVGENCLLNTGAQIDHDCVISKNCHIAPGAILCGNVKVGASTHIGAGAVLIQGVKIGKECIVGAGAVVTKDVPDFTVVVGNPAKKLEK